MTLIELHRRCNKKITKIKIGGFNGIIINPKYHKDLRDWLEGGIHYNYKDYLYLCTDDYKLSGLDIGKFKIQYKASFCVWKESINYIDKFHDISFVELNPNIKIL